jgi:ribonuclease P protein component
MRTRYQVRTEHFLLKLTDKTDRFRFLVVVSKKISKRSNVRNLIKRRTHAIFEKRFRDKSIPSGITIVVLTHNKKIIDTPFLNMEKELLDGVENLYFTYTKRQSGK